MTSKPIDSAAMPKHGQADAAPDGDAQREIVAFLLRPETHGVAAQPQRIDTHASTVVLAGERVYKLKRAVKYPYLDYSTPARRKAACEREVAINRRTAPDIYLGTQPIVRRADGELGLGGAGTPIDWVVEMRRFDDSQLFSHLADRGALTPELAARAAAAVARFHRAAEPTSGFGGAHGLRDTIEGNGASFAALRGAGLDRTRVAAFQRRSLAEWERLAPALDTRAQAGLVRHCHGDLHLANMCLIDGEPTLFDAIEFSDTIANIDTLYDFAFFVMDLHCRELAAAANAAFNRYLELSDDYAGLAAWPLFLATRAAIRAHVSAQAAERAAERAAKPDVAITAEKYFDCAESLLEPAQSSRPMLIAVGGLSGTGKTTLARALAPLVPAASGAVHLRSDVLRKHLAGVDALQRLDDAQYSAAATAKVYAGLAARAAQVLAAGQPVIVDAVAARAEERDMLARTAAAAEAPFVGFWLEAPAGVLRDRVAARRDDASDATVEIVERQLGYDLGRLTWHRLDAALPTRTLVREARARIEAMSDTTTRAGAPD